MCVPSTPGSSCFVGSPHKTSIDDSNDNMVLISLSPSTDKAFVDFQKQLSDSGSATEMPWPTPKSTPQKGAAGAAFEDVVRSSVSSPPAVPFGSPGLRAYHISDNGRDSSFCQAGVPAAICPPPAHNSTNQGTAERPVTLDVSRPRPHAGILKKASPSHHVGHGILLPPKSTPTPSCSTSTSGSHHPSTGSPRITEFFMIEHKKTLLDIDVVGAKSRRHKASSCEGSGSRSHSYRARERVSMTKEFTYIVLI